MCVGCSLKLKANVERLQLIASALCSLCPYQVNNDEVTNSFKAIIYNNQTEEIDKGNVHVEKNLTNHVCKQHSL